MKFTNKNDIPLPLAVWLATDNYDYIDDEKYISATSLLKSTQQIILNSRTKREDRISDVYSQLASKMGSSIHDSIESSWLTNHKTALASLGYSEKIINRILVNPTEEELLSVKRPIPVWLETRSIKELEGYKIGGKFDIILNGEIYDIKTTSVYTYMTGRKDQDYIKQGSIYRWLNPEKLTGDQIHIQFIFTDWDSGGYKRNANYPKQRILNYSLNLLPIPVIEEWILNKVKEIDKYWDYPAEQLPKCSDEDLWKSPTVYKYFADPSNRTKSTKNFDNLMEANTHMYNKASGIVIPYQGEAKACKYCSGASLCAQLKELNG